jgi:hypothetical protein
MLFSINNEITNEGYIHDRMIDNFILLRTTLCISDALQSTWSMKKL